MDPVSEDSPAPSGVVGTLVSVLIDSGGTHNNFSDVDGDLPGIAVVGVNADAGQLWYSIDNGSNWSAAPAVTPESALMLHADSETKMKMSNYMVKILIVLR